MYEKLIARYKYMEKQKILWLVSQGIIVYNSLGKHSFNLELPNHGPHIADKTNQDLINECPFHTCSYYFLRINMLLEALE